MVKERIVKKLVDMGCKMNPRRLLLIEELVSMEEVNDVEQLWIDVRSKMPISWATVHNFLNLLCDYGVLDKLHLRGKSNIYRFKVDLG